MTPPESASVAVELERLHGAFTGFGRDIGDIKTSCAVLVERSNRTEQDVRDLHREMEEEIKAVRAEVDQLRARSWPLPSIAALTGCAGLGVALWQAIGR